MSQRLSLPFTACKVVAGYRMEPYRLYWGYHHYGVDYKATGSTDVLASGDGIVSMTGFDTGVGNTVCVIYKDAYNHKTGEIRDLVARYMHLAKISVTDGQTVRAGDKLGVEGKTGGGKWSEHLHVELDSDTAWPNYSPQVKGANFIRKSPHGYPDTTVNPSDYFHREEYQTVTDGSNPGWTKAADRNLPLKEDEPLASLKSRIVILMRDNESLRQELADVKTELTLLAANL